MDLEYSPKQELYHIAIKIDKNIFAEYICRYSNYEVESLRRGGRFYLCWVADSWPLRFATITHRQLWSQDIREICNDLLEVMKNESGRPTNRFSLRLSSQLLRGLVRLYHRKVIVFVGDLCMINAHVMKRTHKKYNYEEEGHIIRSPELSRFILEILPEEEAVEEKIQNSGNIVSHIEDITLREQTLPENRFLLNDGFGELHSDQPIQLGLGERSVEMMLFREPSAQISALDLPLDFSTEKSHDKSRLNPREAQMERLTEHDISVFGKSMAEGMLLGDFEKEIPEIPDLPHPDLPHTDKELEKSKQEEKDIEKSKGLVTDEIVLEELEDEPQVKKRKLRNRLIIDKRIKLSSDYIRSRVDNNEVETRRERLLAPPAIHPVVLPPGVLGGLLTGSARPLGAALTALHWSTLRTLHTRAGDTHLTQEAVLKEKQHSNMKSFLEKIDEEVEAVVENYEGNLELRDVSKQMDIMDVIVDAAAAGAIQASPKTRRAEERFVDERQSSKRRRCGYVSFRHDRQKSSESSILETNKQNVPQVRDPSTLLTALLQRHGLADCSVPCGGEGNAPRGEGLATGWTLHASGGEGRAPEDGRASETPLGSLDRTKVSLGDSENTTDSKKFIREEWGTQGAMHKIYRCIKSGSSPVDVHSLVSRGPVLCGQRRLIAARCFTSILKLKQHGFIRIDKDSETYEIKDIKFGSKIVRDE